MKLKKTETQNTVFQSFIFIIIGYIVYQINTSYLSDYLGENFEGYMVAYVFVFFLTLIACIYKQDILMKNKLFGLIAIYLILISIQLINLSFSIPLKENIKVIISCTLWIVFLFFGFIIGYQSKQIGKLSETLLICVLPFLMINLVKLYMDSNDILSWHNPDSFFSIIIFLPFILLLKNNMTKIILIIFFGILSFVSIKRSIILGYSIAILIYIILSFSLSKKNPSKEKNNKIQMFYIPLLIIAGVFIIIRINTFFSNEMPYTPLQRFQMINETGGSGRVEIYNTIFSNINHSDFLSLFFGHGYKAVLVINDDKLAHNDLLEILYDFGVFALLIFLMVAAKILMYGFKMLKKNNRDYFSQVVPAFFAGYLLWIILASMNCIIYSIIYFPVMMLFLGMSIGFYHQIIDKEKVDFCSKKQE